MSLPIPKIMLAGVAGTAVMTMVGLFVAPMMGLAPMNPATMLASVMGGSTALGWMAHLMIGVILAFGYALVASRLPGPAVVRGAIYAIAPWLMAQLMVMPMMGMGFFSGSAMVAMGSLIGHMMYGAVVGSILGAEVASPVVPAMRAPR